MNKDLLLVFVIAPLAVEIGKSIIKEIQERRAHKRNKYHSNMHQMRPLLVDLEKSAVQYFAGVYADAPDNKLKNYLLHLVAHLSDIVNTGSEYNDIKPGYNKLATDIGYYMFRRNQKSSILSDLTKSIGDQTEVLLGQIRTMPE